MTMSVDVIVPGLWYDYGAVNHDWTYTPTVVSTDDFAYGDNAAKSFHAVFEPPATQPGDLEYGDAAFTMSFYFWQVATQQYVFSHGGTRNATAVDEDWTGSATTGGQGWWKIMVGKMLPGGYTDSIKNWYVFPDGVPGVDAVITAEAVPRTVAKMRLDTSPDGGSPADGGGP